MLEPPGAPDIGTWEMVTNGILAFPFRFGFKALRRLLQVKSHHERLDRGYLEQRAATAAVAAAARGQDEGGGGAVAAAPEFCTLERMVVRPGLQGRGVGSQCLGQALGRASAAGLGVVLSTQEARNAEFYSRLGFKAVREEAYFSAAPGQWGQAEEPRNWLMVLEPGTYQHRGAEMQSSGLS